MMAGKGNAPRDRIQGAMWLMLGALSLGVAGLAAVLLVISRTPVLADYFPVAGLFRSALVVHVAFAVVVWFFTQAGMIWGLAAGAHRPGLGVWGWGLVALGAGFMLLSPWVGGDRAILNNYFPLWDTPVYGAGLFLVVAGGVVAATRMLLTPVERVSSVEGLRFPRSGLTASAWILFLALVTLLVTGWRMGPGDWTPSRFEYLFWGFGHVLQLFHVALMVTVWIVLAESTGLTLSLSSRVVSINFLIGAIPAMLAPLSPLWFEGRPEEGMAFFTHLMAYGSWLPVPVVFVAILNAALKGGSPSRAGDSGGMIPAVRMALWGSQGLFGAGLLLGGLIRDDSVMVTAHYHGTVGAVTLAYMGLGLRWLAGTGRVIPPFIRWQPALMTASVGALMLGLAWSGSQGISRKVMASQMSVTQPGFMGLLLVGLGGLAALTAVFLYTSWALTHACGVLGAGERSTGGFRLRPRGRVLATLSLIVVMGLVIHALPDSGVYARMVPPSMGTATPSSPEGGVGAMDSPEMAVIRQRFRNGVAMLHARQYERAVKDFHWILERHPELVEAEVNLGYAFLGMKAYGMARDFFQAAIELRATQANAYYGLALSWEGEGDLEMARGAMRSFIHLTRDNDPFLPKARSALWEWESPPMEGGGEEVGRQEG